MRTLGASLKTIGSRLRSIATKHSKWRLHPRFRCHQYQDHHRDRRGQNLGETYLIYERFSTRTPYVKNATFDKQFFLAIYRIRKAGFAIRYTFEEFVNRYHVIMKDLKLPHDGPREMSEALAKRLFGDVEWTIGHRMIFLKVDQMSSLGFNRF